MAAGGKKRRTPRVDSGRESGARARGGLGLKTVHRVWIADARDLGAVPDASVDLVVTSPPYPMIEMWDGVFSTLSPEGAEALRRGDAARAFELFHCELDKVWAECFRALKPGGIACVNVGDAARTIGGSFQLFPNHARVLQSMARIGFAPLPDILWRKPTNAPNKFLGSGMLPGGAYVTYEHEYILIFRKGRNRSFARAAEKRNRRRSAFFWEERNAWFSDVWTDLKGTSQDLLDPAARARSAAFPFELACRLVNMYSVYGDMVLDPFLGTGTTMAAAAASGRNSTGVEIDAALCETIRASARRSVARGSERARARLAAHRAFVAARGAAGRPPRHWNAVHGFPVVTSQETEIELLSPRALREPAPLFFEVEHGRAGEAEGAPAIRPLAPVGAPEGLRRERSAPGRPGGVA